MTTTIIFVILMGLGAVLLAFNYLSRNDSDFIEQEHDEVIAFEAKKETPKMTAKPKKAVKKEVVVSTESAAKPKRKYNKKPKA